MYCSLASWFSNEELILCECVGRESGLDVAKMRLVWTEVGVKMEEMNWG